jgi:hypothetical protein
VDNPRAVDGEPVIQVIAGLTRLVTEAPWTLRGDDLARARSVGLDDNAVLQVLVVSAIFNYLNRVADAVGIELDYEVVIRPPDAEPDTPPLARPEPDAWPDPEAPRPLDLGRRPALARAFADLRTYVLERDAPLTIAHRQLIARTVAACLGDAATVRRFAHAAPQSELDHALVAFAELATLSPWRLGAGALDALRAASLVENAALFDAITVTSFTTMASRLHVALAALAR